jgi:hypothetical protein
MPSQFALSLEVSRLVPLNFVASKAAEAIMALARDLQSSGSDLVIEEDLLNMFGRCRIAQNMERSFRVIVAEQGSAPLSESISLESGPGPTVLRGLTQPSYFATVLQCSLLTWVHERASLATAISHIFEKQNEEAPPDHIFRSIPSQEGILGVLKACEEQTSSFDWNGHIRAVAAILEIPDARAFQPLPAVVLRAVVYMFPLVQTLPEDRFILVETLRGVCLLVVWAHLVLDLTVLVRIWRDGTVFEKKFGSDHEQVFILVDASISEAAVTFLETSSKEEIIKLQPDTDESPIEGIVKGPTKGFGRELLRPLWTGEGSEAILEEMKLISCAFAMIIAENIYMAFGTEMSHMYDESEDDVLPNGLLLAEGAMQCAIPEDRLLNAARLLFDDSRLEGSSIRRYADLYSKRPLNTTMAPILGPPRVVKVVLDQASFLQDHDKAHAWEFLLSTARSLAVIILAFAHVQNLASCENLPLCNMPNVLCNHVLVTQLQTWDGKAGLRLPEDVWLHAIALLMIGHKESATRKAFQSVSLVSDRGWSIYLCTFGTADPSFIHPGSIKIEKGVPSRCGIRKRKVMDGPRGQFDTGWGFEDVVRNQSSILSPKDIALGKPLCGERADSFLVSLRVVRQADPSTVNSTADVRRMGYRELAWALWMVTKTSPCQHSTRIPRDLELPVGCAGVAGFWEWDPTDLDERVIIALTANCPAARWRALLSAAHGRYRASPNSFLKNVLLREPDCYVQCTLNQALMKGERSLLIL